MSATIISISDTFKAYINQLPYKVTVVLYQRDPVTDTYGSGTNFAGQSFDSTNVGPISGQPSQWSVFADNGQSVRPRVGDRLSYGGVNYQVLSTNFSWGDLMAVCECVVEG
jgi:hypothetical protein